MTKKNGAAVAIATFSSARQHLLLKWGSEKLQELHDPKHI